LQVSGILQGSSISLAGSYYSHTGDSF